MTRFRTVGAARWAGPADVKRVFASTVDFAEVAPYFDAPPEKGTAEADRFDVLSTLIEAYEDRLFETILADDPVDFLTSFMEITGRVQRDLAEALGSPSRASEVLRRQRGLTLPMIQRLHDAWGVPTDGLLGRRMAAA